MTVWNSNRVAYSLILSKRFRKKIAPGCSQFGQQIKIQAPHWAVALMGSDRSKCNLHQEDEAVLVFLVLATAYCPGTVSPVQLIQGNLDLIAQFSVFSPCNSFVVNISVQ